MEKNIGLTRFPDDSNWVTGYIEEIVFHAKLYDEGSVYGIDEGRVSKLYANEAGIVYDREWSSGRDNPLVKEIVNFLEKQPKRFG